MTAFYQNTSCGLNGTGDQVFLHKSALHLLYDLRKYENSQHSLWCFEFFFLFKSKILTKQQKKNGSEL